jgi:hypothetical protein
MIIKSNNVLELEAAQGERLTLSFDDPAGIATISYKTPSGEGQLLPGTTHTVTVPAATNHAPVAVSVVCVFKGTGTCKVELTDATGRVASHTFTSAFGMAADAVVYTIDVR